MVSSVGTEGGLRRFGFAVTRFGFDRNAKLLSLAS